MFCPSCGTEDTIGLPYCNRCGANLGSASLPVNEIAPISVTKPILIIGVVMLFLTLGGFAGVLSSAIELTTRSGAKDLSIAMVFFGMITILTIDILLFRLLSKLINAALSSPKAPPKKQTIQAQEQLRFGRPNTSRLESAPSVTEHTTRFLEPVYRSPAEVSDPASREKLEK